MTTRASPAARRTWSVPTDVRLPDPGLVVLPRVGAVGGEVEDEVESLRDRRGLAKIGLDHLDVEPVEPP